MVSAKRIIIYLIGVFIMIRCPDEIWDPILIEADIFKGLNKNVSFTHKLYHLYAVPFVLLYMYLNDYVRDTAKLINIIEVITIALYHIFLGYFLNYNDRIRVLQVSMTLLGSFLQGVFIYILMSHR